MNEIILIFIIETANRSEERVFLTIEKTLRYLKKIEWWFVATFTNLL